MRGGEADREIEDRQWDEEEDGDGRILHLSLQCAGSQSHQDSGHTLESKAAVLSSFPLSHQRRKSHTKIHIAAWPARFTSMIAAMIYEKNKHPGLCEQSPKESTTLLGHVKIANLCNV